MKLNHLLGVIIETISLVSSFDRGLTLDGGSLKTKEHQNPSTREDL